MAVFNIPVDIDDIAFDKMISDELNRSYLIVKDVAAYDKKLLKALKRVIEYYGGNVDE